MPTDTARGPTDAVKFALRGVPGSVGISDRSWPAYAG